MRMQANDPPYNSSGLVFCKLYGRKFIEQVLKVSYPVIMWFTVLDGIVLENCFSE